MLITATSYSCMTGIGIGRALQLAEFCGNDWLWIVNYIPHQCPHEGHLDNDAITVQIHASMYITVVLLLLFNSGYCTTVMYM